MASTRRRRDCRSGLEGRTNWLLHNSRPPSLLVLGQLPERAEDEDDCDDHSDPPHAGRGEGRRNERHEEGEPQHRGNGARASPGAVRHVLIAGIGR